MSLRERVLSKGPKKLLAIDGGGIRGVLALEILSKIEAIFAKGREGYVLANDFDYIAGTSTGGIIASGLSCGMRVSDIMDFYVQSGPKMFEKEWLLKRVYADFRSEPLALELQRVFGADTTLGSKKLRTLLLLVMRNATTDSPWPISNNPFAKYNNPQRANCNCLIPLWQLVRASTAAPTYFPPEPIKVGDKIHLFVDGGVTVYNNPAFQMVLMATLDRYWPLAPEGQRGWATGEKEMLVVSVGTGLSPIADDALTPANMNLLYNASHIPSALMNAAQIEQDLLCRVFGNCLAGDQIDREIGDLIDAQGLVAEKRFTYVRYNTELTRPGLDAVGCERIDPLPIRNLAAVSQIDALREVGRAVADWKVKVAHFDGFLA
ncbi:patatin-like phospholipase family protein [Methylocella tundrae]|uniref:Patatin n=1 Tax=Methylocella tundrae TaxID=227605 RepID=A0A4U8Z4T9_METTU|nr:patatin-like phospholipase family protein [Methylocella tundrae]WPP04219.1 patatin-like phospholipase family protein [Methylocella tundrae]VFU10510.1 Patatin [Methylocella tundrae]